MTKKAKLQPRLMPHSPAGSVTVYSDNPPTPASNKPSSQEAKCTCCCHTRSKEVPQEDTTREEQEAYDLMVEGGLIFIIINMAIVIMGTAYSYTHVSIHIEHGAESNHF